MNEKDFGLGIDGWEYCPHPIPTEQDEESINGWWD